MGTTFGIVLFLVIVGVPWVAALISLGGTGRQMHTTREVRDDRGYLGGETRA